MLKLTLYIVLLFSLAVAFPQGFEQNESPPTLEFPEEFEEDDPTAEESDQFEENENLPIGEIPQGFGEQGKSSPARFGAVLRLFVQVARFKLRLLRKARLRKIKGSKIKKVKSKSITPKTTDPSERISKTKVLDTIDSTVMLLSNNSLVEEEPLPEVTNVEEAKTGNDVVVPEKVIEVSNDVKTPQKLVTPTKGVMKSAEQLAREEEEESWDWQ